MKTLILTTVGALMLLPVHNAAAKGKTYGGFKPNYNFSFKIGTVLSNEISLANPFQPKNVKIPKGLPKYNKGQTVKFRIGNKGELIAPGAKIPFLQDGGTSNAYSRVTLGANSKTDTASIFKDSKNKAIGGSMVFTRITGTGFNMKTYTLTYTFD